MMWNGPFGMGGWGGWGWLGPFHFIVPILFWGLIITVVVLLIRYAIGSGRQASRSERTSPGLDVLEERYARGEVKRDEYLEKKRDISG